MTVTTPAPYGSRQSRRRQTWDRLRKRRQRQALREAGAPRAEAVDAALVAGLRAALTRHGATARREGEQAVVTLVGEAHIAEVLRVAYANLKGREGVEKRAVTGAVLARLGLA